MRIATVVGNRPSSSRPRPCPGRCGSATRRSWSTRANTTTPSSPTSSSRSSSCRRPITTWGVAGGSNGSQLARMIAALEPLLERVEPDALMLYGDTNSTLAGALVGPTSVSR